MPNETHRQAAEDYFIALAEKEYAIYSKLKPETPQWWKHRDAYCSLSNTAAQLMGDKTTQPFIW